MSSRSEQARSRAAAVRVEQEAVARRQRTARIGAVTAVLLVVGAAVALGVAGRDDGSEAGTPTARGLQTGPPPWRPQAAGLAERLAPFDLPAVGDESYHAHALLSVFRDGEPVTVPANIGFDNRGGHSSLHTHTPDGVIHMEADDPYPYELAQVFAAWGVDFGEDRLGGDTAGGGKDVHVYVNGEPAPPGPVTMDEGDNIVVAYGTEDSFPKLPPADALEGA